MSPRVHSIELTGLYFEPIYSGRMRSTFFYAQQNDQPREGDTLVISKAGSEVPRRASFTITHVAGTRDLEICCLQPGWVCVSLERVDEPKADETPAAVVTSDAYFVLPSVGDPAIDKAIHTLAQRMMQTERAHSVGISVLFKRVTALDGEASQMSRRIHAVEGDVMKLQRSRRAARDSGF